MKSRKLCSIRAILLALVCFWSAQIGLAQSTAALSGRVEDSTGAAIAGAMVTLTSEETAAVRALTSDEAGNYRFLALPVGRYAVRAEKAGFRAEVQTGVNLVVGQQAVLNVQLAVGAVQDQVTVTGEAQLVNTTTSSVWSGRRAAGEGVAAQWSASIC
jgi:hypothetical protein